MRMLLLKDLNYYQWEITITITITISISISINTWISSKITKLTIITLTLTTIRINLIVILTTSQCEETLRC